MDNNQNNQYNQNPQQGQQDQYNQQPNYGYQQQPQYNQQQQWQQQPYNQQYGYYPPVQDVPGKNKAIVGLILGIVSIVFCWLGISTAVVGSIIALGCGIAGTILAVQAKKLMPPMQNGIATGAMVCSIIGIVLSVIMSICAITVYATLCSAANAVGSIYNSYGW